MSSPAEERRRIKDLFLTLEDLPREERIERLEACDDTMLRAAVEELFEASDRADGYFDAIGGSPARMAAPTRPREEDLGGTRIGAYELESSLGSGGMGTVWLARRADGTFSQQVAIKLLVAGPADALVRSRFEAEREILATLSHKHIATLFDGGVTEDDRPYFVMEYIDGRPIDVHCDEEKLGVDERIELMLQVCDALAHAHAQGIVHRDLKPANVLVTREGDVKLLDFGIAKIIGGRPGVLALETGTGLSPMTPAFASPEQLQGRTVTTATDVYSLGTLLYLLLAGGLPYQSDTDSQLAMIHAICEAPAPAPSLRFATRTATSVSKFDRDRIAEARGATAGGLAKRLRGDLDVIVLMALRKEPSRRYASAAELGEDLRRHRDHRPLTARPDSTVYRVRRYLGRHKAASRVAAVAALLLVVATVVALRASWRSQDRSDVIAEEREKNDALLTQLKALYATADPWTPGSDPEARGLLDAAVAQLEAAPPTDAPTHAALLHAAGRVYMRLAEFGTAKRLLDQAVARMRSDLDGDPADLAAALFDLGEATGSAGDSTGGVALLEESLAMELELRGPDALEVGRIRRALGAAFHGSARGGDSRDEFREAIRIFRLHTGGDDESHASALTALAEYLAISGERDEAAELFRESLERWEALYGRDHPAYAQSAEGLGMLYGKLDRQAEGLELLAHALEVRRRVYAGTDHPTLAWNLLNYGATLAWTGDDAGIPLIEEAIDMFSRNPMTGIGTLAMAYSSMGRMQASRDLEASIAAYEDALKLYQANGTPVFMQGGVRRPLVDVLERAGRLDRAIEVQSELVEAYRTRRGPDDRRTVQARETLERLERAANPD